MKKIFSLLLLSAGILGTAAAQSVYNTSANNAGIGTTSPTGVSGYGNVTLNGTNGGYIDFFTNNTSNKRAAITGDVSGLSLYSYNNQPVRLLINNQPLFSLYGDGSLGLGTTTPQSTFHMVGMGSGRHTTSQYSGNLIVQANSGSRSSTQGASLEFVIPANADGANPWGQARIIAVAGNTQNGDATGKLILGTRRWFDKGTGTGTIWNYGDDVVIDGIGNVGIGTSTPDTKLAVNGSIHAKEVKVDLNGWSVGDYAFEKNYHLRSLEEVKAYVDKFHHLPEVASATQLEKEGINLTEMNLKLLLKVEELTLYIINQNRKITRIEHQLHEQRIHINRKKQ